MELLHFKEIAEANNKQYFNQIVSKVNDHVVRMGVMTSQYPWHKHPDSDETFIGVEGIVIIETPDSIFELLPGSCITIPKDLVHRTRPKLHRSVNLTVESEAMTTILVDDIALYNETEDNIR